MESSRFLIQGINDVLSKKDDSYLPTTFGKVVAYEVTGKTVDVELVLKSEGLTPYKNIPLVKNKYVTYPINNGDYVLLISINHLLENFVTTGLIIDAIELNSYVAIPFALEFDLKDITNAIHLNSLNGSVKGFINDEKVEIKSSQADFNMQMQSINIESLNLVTIGRGNITLGYIFERLIQILSTSQTEIASGPAPHVHQTIGSSFRVELQNLLTEIKQALG